MFPTLSTITSWLACPLDTARTRSVLLVRHALAAQGGDGPDEQRALTKEGRDDALRLGGALRAHGLAPDAIVTSPARRAQDTAVCIARSVGFSQDIRIEPSLYGGGAAGIGATLRMLSPDDSRVLIVGHDPGISECLERLTGAREGLPPGGFAHIELDTDDWSHLNDVSRRSRLVRLWRPRDASRVTSDVLPQIDRNAPSKWIAGRIDEPLVDAAARTIEQKLEDVLDRLAAVADTMAEDEDAIRRLRVAARRAEAALRVYRAVLPRRGFARLRDQMRAIRKATNAARDDDVLLARLDSPAMAEVVARLQEDRRAARRGVHALCRRLAGDAKLARRMGDLSSKTRGRRGEEDAATPFGAWARTRLARSAERFFAVASVDVADVDDLHELRRRTKKLRYEVEILAGVLPGRLRSEMYPILTELQDRLGSVNDHAVAVRCLRRLARTQPAGNSIDALDASVVESESALTKSCDDFAAWWTSDRRDSLQQDFSRLR